MNPSIQNIAEIEVSYHPAISNKPVITTSSDVFNGLIEFFSPETISLQEQFVVMYINRANRVLGVYKLSQGGITGTVADTRLILGTALKVAATGIILAHNHPSGNLRPSYQDEELTKRINEACKLLDSKLMDHLIISPEREFYSMAEEGLI